MRLDVYLFQRGFTKSRERAKVLVEEGNVKVNGVTVSKPSYALDDNAEYSIEMFDDCPYVSRGGLKLERILNDTGISVDGCTCIDIGASTGGFTHCLLLNGARKVYAIDSGTNQLDETLKNDDRVISKEGYNARTIEIDHIGELADIITIDVSFISQTLILPNALRLLKDGGYYLSLIKPQFEVGKSNVGKNGIVKDSNARYIAVKKVIDGAAACLFNCCYLAKSPIKGGDGNIEYVAAFSKLEESIDECTIKRIVYEK